MLHSTRLQAVRMDTRVAAWLAERPEGRVHSEFSRACNLAWGAYLISLVPPAYGMMPGGVAVAYAGGFRPGEPVFWDGERLHGAGQTVSLSGAAPWTNKRPVSHPVCSQEFLGGMTEVALRQGRGELVRLLAPGAAPAGGWSSFAVGPVHALLEALRTGRHAALAEVASSLVGLGEGLTPSCDDLLLGVLAVLHYGGAPGFAPLAAAVRAHAAGTTPVSANYLRQAADGGFSEKIETAALALLSEGDAPAAAAALIESGHSSGTDSLVGIIMAGRISARSAPDR